AQIGLAEAVRLAGQNDTVRRRLAELDPSALPDRAKDAIAAVSTKLLLDEHKPDRVVAFLIDYRRTRGSLSGELRLLQIAGLDAAAAALATARNAAEAAELREQIPTVVRWTEAEHGGYWAYRARLAARRAERSARYGTAVAEQVHRAEAAAHSGTFEDAADAYGQAAELAAGDSDLVLELESLRASMLLKSGRFEDAAKGFISVAERESRPEKAAEAHLLSAYALGLFHDAEPSAERRAAYVERLEEHRSRFSRTDTAAEATLRLARLYEQRRQYSQALPLYREIVGESTRGPAAAASIARNYENLLRYLKSAQAKPATAEEATVRADQYALWSQAAVQELTMLTAPLREAAETAAPLSMHEAELALRASQIMLTNSDGTSTADQMLDRLNATLVEAHPPEEQSFWEAVRRSSRPLSIVSLANRGRYGDAERLVASLSAAPMGDLLAVVKGLSEITDPNAGVRRQAVFGAAEGAVGPRLADLRRTATDVLAERRQELTAAEAEQLDVILARSNLADGRSEAASERFASALDRRPNDRALLMQAAASLAASGDPSAIEQARDYWRRLESLEAAGSDAWFKARLNVIETSLTLGDVAEARKLLSVTRLLHPHLGGSETKAAYDAIQRRLGAETAGGRKSQSR
nr:hypothetical protein [Planctomycetota bacterium]